nr:MAG TPA: hypothetical protein [Caudoviricetes sp.]
MTYYSICHILLYTKKDTQSDVLFKIYKLRRFS